VRSIVLVFALCWSSLAVADSQANGKKLATETVERYDAVIADRGIFAKLWDLTGNSVYKNLQHAREDFDEMRADFDKAVAAQNAGSPDGSQFEVDDRFERMKQSAERLDEEIAAYKTDSAAIVWKLQLAAGVIAVAIVGMAVWSLRRRKQTTYARR
jgi:site-specific recombinase